MSQTRKVSYMYDGEVLQAADVTMSDSSSLQALQALSMGPQDSLPVSYNALQRRQLHHITLGRSTP